MLPLAETWQVAAFLGGYGLLMALAQVRLLPAYARLPFMPSTWAFTFNWAAVATTVTYWLNDIRPGGYLFGWTAIMAFVLFPAPHHLMPSSAAYWLLMQIGMIIGYFTSWPANVWLVNRGIKVPM